MSKKETTKTPAKKSAKSAAKTAVKPAAAKKAAAEAVAAKPAAKTAVKTAVVKKTAAKKAVPVAVAAPKKTVAKKAVKKAVKKAEKGRDLVTDEPGAVEVAAVLDEHKAEKAAMDAAQEREEVAEFKASQPASTDSEAEDETEAADFKGPEPKLERLQKILAKAGISSRRKAEELILGGQVQINGKVVTELGTKADPERDHVRVDGKLLQGPERIRYFVLNKPKGFVTTVSDPEGRPTVMQFFATERERLYPVGRLDYLSEGLLLVTNDGELANKLTKAASGVEKTYLVKVAGQPTEDMLDVLRSGVVIERGRPGENTGRVRTAPAKIRQVRQGDNPWYEVIIIEGRNRELRKMFEEIGHHVEKIRRVGYGPLILDLEPGKLRELEAEEVQRCAWPPKASSRKRTRRAPPPASCRRSPARPFATRSRTASRVLNPRVKSGPNSRPSRRPSSSLPSALCPKQPSNRPVNRNSNRNSRRNSNRLQEGVRRRRGFGV
jgi:23S rRNA pseudouridine2605 synthase